LLVATAAACGADGGGDGAEPTATTSESLCSGVIGVDFNDNGGACQNVDFAAFKAAGGAFVMMKATEGTEPSVSGWQYVPANFGRDWPAAKTAGLVRGAYGYLHLELPGDAQAQYLYDTVKSAGGMGPGDMPLMLDLEQACQQDWNDCPGYGQGCCPGCCPNWANCTTTAGQCTSGIYSPSQIQAVAQSFLDRAQALTGRPPIIYTYGWYWTNRVGAPASMAKYPLWFADCTNCACPPAPGTVAPWGSATFDQFNWNASAGGIPNGCADEDAFNGTLAQLQQFAAAQFGLTQLPSNGWMTAVNWPDDELEVFAKTKAGTALHVYTSPSSSSTWTMTYPLNGAASCGLSALMTGAGAQLYDPTSTGGAQWLGWNGTGWSSFAALSGSPSGVQLGPVTTLAWPDGHFSLFALGSDGAVWRDDTNASGAWGSWTSMAKPSGGVFATIPAAMYWSVAGHGEVFATDSAGTVWHSWSGANGWAGWQKLGTGSGAAAVASRPIPVEWLDGHGEIFARSVQGQLVHSVAGASGWSAFSAIAPGTTIAGDPGAVMNVAVGSTTAGPEVFVRDPSGKVLHLGWNGSAYTAPAPLGSQTSIADPFGWVRGDGSAVVFAIDASGNLQSASRGGSGSWSSWTTIATSIDACPKDDVTGIGGDAGAPDGGPDGGAVDGGAQPDAEVDGATGDGGISLEAAASGSGKGCGCTTAGGRGSSRALWSVLAICALLARRRDRRAP
jgi:lysozyme